MSYCSISIARDAKFGRGCPPSLGEAGDAVWEEEHGRETQLGLMSEREFESVMFVSECVE